MANLRTAYVLWFFGGILGLHHLYLNRPRHCFIWFVTWGGMALGWLTEVMQIKDYVDEANQSKEFLEKMKVVKKHSPKPGFSIMLLGSQLMIGHQLGKVLICSLPEYYTVHTWYAPYLSHFLAALGASIGVNLASNIGPQKAPFLLPFLASLATIPSALVLYNRRNIYIMVCVITASAVSGHFSKWSTRKRSSDLIGYLKMFGCLGLAVSTYVALWTSNIYHNTYVNTLNGTKIPLPDAMYNFYKTQPWDEARDVIHDILPCLRMYNMESCQYQILSRLAELSDPERDAWAFEVLGLERYPSQKQIVSHCRKMSSKWHPDRFAKKNDTEKEAAEKKFIDIQKACGMLNKLKMNRERKNTWATSASEQHETVFTTSFDDVTTNNRDENIVDIDDNAKSYDETAHYCDDSENCNNFDDVDYSDYNEYEPMDHSDDNFEVNEDLEGNNFCADSSKECN